MPFIVLSAVHALAPIGRIAILGGRRYYHFHFTDGETSSEKLKCPTSQSQ